MSKSVQKRLACQKKLPDPFANKEVYKNVGDYAQCLAKQAIDEKWNEAQLGFAIVQFAMAYNASIASSILKGIGR